MDQLKIKSRQITTDHDKSQKITTKKTNHDKNKSRQKTNHDKKTNYAKNKSRQKTNYDKKQITTNIKSERNMTYAQNLFNPTENEIKNSILIFNCLFDQN